MKSTTLLITIITATAATASTLPATNPPNAVAREVTNVAAPAVARAAENDVHGHDKCEDEEIEKRAHRSGRGRTQTFRPASSGAGMGKVNGAVLVAGVLGAVGAGLV